MDALKAILTRRSCRRFTAQPVSESVVENILRAAMSAPSAVNEQPWHFIVVNERAMLDKIPSIHPHAMMCNQAAVAIVPCIDLETEKYKDYWVQDMSAATENILLAARALGLGAVWLGVYPNKDRMSGIRKIFDIPELVVPFCVVPIGYSDVPQIEDKDRIKKERIYYNKWK